MKKKSNKHKFGIVLLTILMSPMLMFSQGYSANTEMPINIQTGVTMPEALDPVENPYIEFDAWYGFTFSNQTDQNGLRRFDLKYLPNTRNLIYAYYDNALILDNASLSNIERTAPILGAGIKYDWNSTWFTKLEAGKRFLETEQDQVLVNLENGWFLSDKWLVKNMIQYDWRENNNLITLAGFVEHAISRDFRLELGAFHSQNTTQSNISNQRLMLVPKFKAQKIELLGGIYFDNIRFLDINRQQFGGVFGLLSYQIKSLTTAKVFYNYDKGVNNPVNIVSLGLNQKL